MQGFCFKRKTWSVMLQTNMNDNKKEIRERKHSSFDSIVC